MSDAILEVQMLSRKSLSRTIALAGTLAVLAGSSAFAQDRNYPRTPDQNGYRNDGNRTVDGTVASVVRDRNGDRVRLADGMELFVPNSVTTMSQGRLYSASMLQPGDVVRMNVYSRQGDSRLAQVRSLELVRRNVITGNDRRMNGTVVSVDRRARVLVMQTDTGRTISVDLNAYAARGLMTGNFRRGDRISVAGRMNRGTVIADDVRVNARNNDRRY
jgi:hypothetical protein